MFGTFNHEEKLEAEIGKNFNRLETWSGNLYKKGPDSNLFKRFLLAIPRSLLRGLPLENV